MQPEWRADPLLAGRFHPEYPDDLQVIVHDGGPRLSSQPPELMWVRVEGRQGEAYVGQVLNDPSGLKSVRQGETILFLATKSAPHPFRVSSKYLEERISWTILPCNRCGLPELWDAPSDLLPKIFPALPPGAELETFTAFCPFCGGVQVATRRAQEPPAPSGCGRCGRPLKGALRCVYCGWTEDEELKQVDEAGKVPRETFRCSATLWPFFASAGLLTAIAALVLWKTWSDDGPEGWGPVFTVSCLMFFGPVLFIAQLMRHKLVWAEFDPPRGILLSGRSLIAWDAIDSIEWYPGIFSYRETFEELVGKMSYTNGCISIPVLVGYSVFLPIISVLSPWHARVTIKLRNGERVVLRDLEDGQRFVRTVRRKIE